MFVTQPPPAPVLASLALFFLGCSTEPPVLEPGYPLVEHFPRARVSAEVTELAMGSPEVVAHLGDGWSYRELDRGRDRHFRWSLRSRSEASFFVAQPRDVTLVLEGRPRHAPQTVTVTVNQRPAGAAELGAGLAEYRIQVPAESLRQGGNRLTLGYGPDPEPAAADPPGDRTTIRVAWYRIGLEGLHTESAGPVAEADGERLFLPYGSQVDYFLKLPENAALRADRWGFRGAGPGRLEVDIASDATPDRRLASLDETGDLDLPLELEPLQPVRLSLRAIGPDPAADGGVLLSRPAVWSTPVVTAPRDGTALRPKAPPRRPNIVVYLVDTLRSDRLGCYGHTRPVSPRIDRFAEGATLFETARAQSTWTLASVASVFTGVWPHSHGVTHNQHRLSPAAVTLPEILQAAGYATSAVVTNGYVTEAFGLEQGFDELVLLHADTAQAVHREMVRWLAGRDRSRPFFLYLHTLEPHKPYLPPEEYRRRFAPGTDEIVRIIRGTPRKTKWEPTASNIGQLLALYDAEIAANDAAFGDALDHLDQSGLLDDALVVFLSDHGEGFHEHGTWGHGANLFSEVLNVPLIVKLPGQRTGRRVTETVQHVDLLPTLLEYLDLDGPPVEGRSLLPLLGDRPVDPVYRLRPLFFQTSRHTPDNLAVIDGDWKYIERRDPKRGLWQYLYQWRQDPEEQRLRIAEQPIRVAALRALIDEQLAATRLYQSEASEIDDRLREHLRALGYLN